MKSQYYYKYGSPVDNTGYGFIGRILLIIGFTILAGLIAIDLFKFGNLSCGTSSYIFAELLILIGFINKAMDQTRKVASVQKRVPTGYRIIEVRQPGWSCCNYAVQQRNGFGDWYDLSHYGSVLSENDTKRHPSTYRKYEEAEKFLKMHMKSHPVDIDYEKARKIGLDAVLHREKIYGDSGKTLIEFTDPYQA